MRVLCVTRAYNQNAGGMEKLSYELINRLKSQPGVSVDIIAYHGHRLLSPFFIITCLPQVFLLIGKADVVHLGDPMLSFVGFFAKTFYKKPVAVTVHGLDVAYPNVLYQTYLQLFFHQFDLYVPISNYVAGLLKQRNVKGKVTVVRPAIKDNYFNSTAKRAELDEVLNRVTADKKVLLTTGRLVARKGHAWFVTHVLPKLPTNVLYVIAGSGPEFEAIKDAAGAAKVVGQVIMLGRVSDEQLKVLYNTADAFIQPNIKVEGDMEGFGLVLLEAAACGLPVFASELEGIPDAIAHGQNGRLIEAENSEAWTQAINNFLLNTQRSLTARNYTLENFSWQKTIRQFSQELAGV